MLVSDQPMVPEGVKTEASDRKVTDNFVQRHVEIGVEAPRLIRRHGKSIRHLRHKDGPGGD
jgi:AMP nucleosidase